MHLAERYTAERTDAACQRALAFDLIDVRRLERILIQALEREGLPLREPGTAPPPPARFARPGSAFAHQSQDQRR